MKSRGRVSAASHEISALAPMANQRPEVPFNELTPEQAEEWVAVVNRLPADWFPRETHALLVQYCRHVVRARRVAQWLDRIERSEKVDPDEYRALVRAEADLSRAITALARSMRLTQQSLYSPNKTKPGTIDGPKPWET